MAVKKKAKSKVTSKMSVSEQKKELLKHKAYTEMNKKKLSPNVRAQAEEILKRQESRIKRTEAVQKAEAKLAKKTTTKKRKTK